ncbi:MAG: hypothetical protein JXB49_13710, partial [Bacteroidales bacterium]|nr:hypothetical protein [Bacteroidales bacterium]
NYAIYGPLFVIGVLGICIKSIMLKIPSNFIYIRYVFITIAMSLLTGEGFSVSHFIVCVACLMYMIDTSDFQTLTTNRRTET